MFTSVLLKDHRMTNIPAGLIVPYNGTTAPSGWTLFTSADGKFLIGAGNTYAVGATGGSTSLTTASSDSQGGHSVMSPSTLVRDSASTIEGAKKYTAGAHTHTLTYNYTPSYYGLRLIKADSELPTFPPKAVIFSGSSVSGLSRFSSGDGALFSPRSSLGAGGSNSIGATTSSSDGVHSHGEDNGQGGFTGSFYPLTSAGGHTHSNSTFVITPNLYRVLLSAWTDASNAFNLKVGMYAFYENTTPPDGWYLCNGSNGTLDLRDYFIEFTDEDDDGTKTGNGTLSVPDITLATSTWSHTHASVTQCLNENQYDHQSTSVSHGHTIAGTTPTFLPQYYALAIIQLAA